MNWATSGRRSSSRSASPAAILRETSEARAPIVESSVECVNRALEVQAALAEQSQHRGVQLSDLLTAACAEDADLTVLHYNADFELIASVTDQPTRWVVPRGSVS
jgi:predicted nucleic acid-binding protein